MKVGTMTKGMIAMSKQVIVEVTSKSYYLFPQGVPSRFDSEQEFFDSYFYEKNMDHHHAHRDKSKIGGAVFVENVRQVTEEQYNRTFSKDVEESDEKINEAQRILDTMKGWPEGSVMMKGVTNSGNVMEYENEWGSNE